MSLAGPGGGEGWAGVSEPLFWGAECHGGGSNRGVGELWGCPGGNGASDAEAAEVSPAVAQPLGRLGRFLGPPADAEVR